MKAMTNTTNMINAINTTNATKATKVTKKKKSQKHGELDGSDEQRRIFLPFRISIHKSIGLYVLVDKISDELGLLEALMDTFGEDIAYLILDLSMYLLQRDQAPAYLEAFPSWLDTHKTFSDPDYIQPVDPETGEELKEFFNKTGWSWRGGLFSEDSYGGDDISFLADISSSLIEHFKNRWNEAHPKLGRKSRDNILQIMFDEEYDRPEGVTIVETEEEARRLTLQDLKRQRKEAEERALGIKPRLRPINSLLYFVASILYSVLYKSTANLRRNLMYAEKKEWMREYADREPTEQKAIADEHVTNRFIMHSIIAELDNIRCYVDIEKFERAVRSGRRKIPVEYVFSDHVYYKRQQIVESLGIEAELEAERKRLETFCWLEEVRYGE